MNEIVNKQGFQYRLSCFKVQEKQRQTFHREQFMTERQRQAVILWTGGWTEQVTEILLKTQYFWKGYTLVSKARPAGHPIVQSLGQNTLSYRIPKKYRENSEKDKKKEKRCSIFRLSNYILIFP